jgi:hypothetical protein
MSQGMHLLTREEYHRAHTIERMEQRYSITLTHDEYDELCQRVRDGKCIYVSSCGKYAGRFVITWKDNLIPVIFSYLTKQVSTAQPPESLLDMQRRIREALWIRSTYKHLLPPTKK